MTATAMPFYSKLQLYSYDRDQLFELAKLELQLATAQANERAATIAQATQPEKVITVNRPYVDWTVAPPWANFHAFDGDAVGWWWENFPEIEFHRWRDKKRGNTQASGFTLPLGNDWRWSLTPRT